MADMKTFIGKIADGGSLSETEAARAFDIIMSGDATDVQIGAFLLALRVRGETVEEITGAARTMRAKATGVQAPARFHRYCRHRRGRQREPIIFQPAPPLLQLVLVLLLPSMAARLSRQNLAPAMCSTRLASNWALPPNW